MLLVEPREIKNKAGAAIYRYASLHALHLPKTLLSKFFLVQIFGMSLACTCTTGPYLQSVDSENCMREINIWTELVLYFDNISCGETGPPHSPILMFAHKPNGRANHKSWIYYDKPRFPCCGLVTTVTYIPW